MRKIILAASLLTFASVAFQTPSFAQNAPGGPSLEVTGPQEVGNTSMPAGNYLITEQTTGKSYSLMVSNKGTMMLAPAPTGAGTAAAPAAAAAAPVATGSSTVKNLMHEGLQKGMTGLMEKNAANSLEKFIK